MTGIKSILLSGFAAALCAVFAGCPSDGSGGGSGSGSPEPVATDKTVTGLTIIRFPYRVTYNGNPSAPSFERDAMLSFLGGDAARLPAHIGYREGEFITDYDLLAPEQDSRLILHGLTIRVHYRDRSVEDVEFPRDRERMLSMGSGRGMRFAWSPGREWAFLVREYVEISLDGVKAEFDIPYYTLQAVMIDKPETDRLAPTITGGTVDQYTYESEAGISGRRPKIGVVGYYERIGWHGVPEKVRIEAPAVSRAVTLRVYRGYTPLYAVDPSEYVLEPENIVAEPWPARYIQSGIPVPRNLVSIFPYPDRADPPPSAVLPYAPVPNIPNPDPDRYVQTYTIP